MIFNGIPGSNGIAIGEVYVCKREEILIDRNCISVDDMNEEFEKLNKGISLTKEQLIQLEEEAAEKTGEGEAQIFDAHVMILEDSALSEEIINFIKRDRITAAFAVEQVINQFAGIFMKMEDEYMRERAGDFKDVGNRLVRNVLGLTPKDWKCLKKEAVIVADELTPSDTISLNKRLVKGIVVDKGGRTSHAAIIARTLEIPAVLGLKNISRQVQNGDSILLDGKTGTVIVNPNENQRADYQKKLEEYHVSQIKLQTLLDLPAVTRDGRQVEIAANIGGPQDVEAVIKNKGEGIGLYRTEFLYMDRDGLPDEQEQFDAYKAVAVRIDGKPLIIRTLDIGGDKQVKALNMPQEMNPFLGWRAIRMCLARKDIFKTQLRAILRASAYGNILVMYPMISGIREVREANAVLAEAKQELRNTHIPFDENIKVGIMVEIPSAALTVDTLVKEVDFFSIGTNDLCQYTLAVDRMNDRISYMYQPMHPAVLRLIKNVIDVSHQHGKFTGMCGEMAGDPIATAILLGLGLDEFSMSAAAMLEVKKIIRSLSFKEAQETAALVLSMETPEEVSEYAASLLETVKVVGDHCDT